MDTPQNKQGESKVIHSRMRVEICNWCQNRDRNVCRPCGEEGKYRWLEAVTLESWELPPELPSMRILADMNGQEKFAFMWLALRFSERERTRVI